MVLIPGIPHERITAVKGGVTHPSAKQNCMVMLSVAFYKYSIFSEAGINLRCLYLFYRNELYFHSLILTSIANQGKKGAPIRVILSPAYKNQQNLLNTPIEFYMVRYTHCTNMYLYNTSTYVVSYFWTINY